MPEEKIDTMGEDVNGASDTQSEENGALATDGDSSTPVDMGDDLLSTAEFTQVDAGEEDQQGLEDGKKAGEGEETGEGEGSEDDKGPVPYDRFQEKVKHIEDLQAKLETMEQKLNDIAAGTVKPEGSAAEDNNQKADKFGEYDNYYPMQNLSDEKIQDWFDQKPLEFVGNLAAQIQTDTVRVVKQLLQREAPRFVKQVMDQESIATTYQQKLNEFGEKNEGFTEMLNSGKLDEYAKSNPGFDVFSAYHELTSDTREQSIQQRIDDAVAKATEKVKQEYEKNLKAKRHLKPIGPGPSTTHNPNKELENTKANGGLVASLAERVMRRRSSAAG